MPPESPTNLRPRRLGSARRWIVLVVAAAALAGACKAPPSRQKTDVLVLANGDRITGEVKKLEQGKLKLKTSALDTVYVEWDKVARLTSTYAFQFEDTEGARHYGRVVAQDGDHLTIEDEQGGHSTLRFAEIVEITPIDESFWARLDGGISLGFDYNKGSDIGQVLANANLEHRTRKAHNELDFSTTVTIDSQEERTSRSTLSYSLDRYLGRWFGWGLASLDKNESLGLDLRATVAGGVGRSLISTSRSLVDVGVGLAVSEEDAADSGSGSSEVEGVIRANFSVFSFGEREVDSDFELLVFPGITESDRLRGELDASVRREIAKNLYLELSGYISYDNEPSAGAEESDYGVSTNIGWSF